MDRLVQWKQTPVSVKSVPFEGGPVQHGDNCDSSYAYVYAGHGVTDGNGVWHIRLSDVTCDTPGPRHGSIPSVVATPTYGFLDQKPPVVPPPPPAVLVAFVAADTISIYSFGPQGQPMPAVPFSWHCVVEGELVGQKKG
jgi:hypothetical protein